jgi:hypothetical protein
LSCGKNPGKMVHPTEFESVTSAFGGHQSIIIPT